MSRSPRSRRSPDAPAEDPASTLSPTALRILAAAKQILSTDGYEGLTLDAVAREAKVNKAATHYHFGSKAGLIEAIVDEIVLDECAFMSHDVSPDASLDERVESLIEGVRRMAIEPATFGGYFDILPYALRDDGLRQRLARLYDVWFQWNLEWAGLGRSEQEVKDDDLKAMGRLMAAMVDGIAIQASIEGRHYDPEPTLRALRTCLMKVLGTVRGAKHDTG
jgi:AcrR family transcriptional regulator